MRAVIFAWLFGAALAAHADERILEFHSDIAIQANGWIEVTETIKVRAEGSQIRRGIYRDFPTEYRDKLGNDYVVDFQVLSVFRNDAPEAFHTRELRNGERTYFGRSDRFLPHGVHTYRFRYRASRMLGFFEEHDELYWNVTGFGWQFPIDAASATVSFAFDVDPDSLRIDAYTGPYGGRAQEFTSRITPEGNVHFDSTNPLHAANGLTIVVGWLKGLVEQPTGMQRLGWLLKDNANLLVALGGLLGVLAFYIPVWMHFGRDPEEGVLVTRYEPPKGFSPASLRYIWQMHYDAKVMTAAIVNLAVKGYLQIVHSDDEHSLSKNDPGPNAPPMSPGEKELYSELFRGGTDIVLKQDNHEALGEAKSEHRRSLKEDYKQNYFKTNGAMNIPAIIIVLTTMAISLAIKPTPMVFATIAAMFIVMVFFAIIMKRPTIRGRRLLDQMMGFKDYLETAEKYEMNLRNPPEKTPELFEKYLPFALALGVDQQWSKKFAAVLAGIRDEEDGAYHPHWYSGTWNSNNIVANTDSLSGDFSSAISSSVTPPGSSSGGGGGGFSGGGGGGGGGGGW